MAYRRLVLITLALILLASACAIAQETVKLQMKFTPGEVLRYKMLLDGNIAFTATGPNAPQAPNMPMRMVAVVKQKTKRVLPSGDAEVTAVLESMKVSIAGKTHELTKKDMATPITMIMGRNGQVKSMAGSEKLTGQFKGMNFMNPGSMGQFGALPDGDLTVGESWSQSMPFPMGGGSMLLIGKVVSANERLGNTRVAVIRQDISADLDLGAQMTAMMNQKASLPPGVSAKGQFTGSGTTFLSPEKGRLMRAEGAFQARANMKGPSNQGGPSSMDMDFSISFEMYLLSAN